MSTAGSASGPARPDEVGASVGQVALHVDDDVGAPAGRAIRSASKMRSEPEA